MTPKRGFPRDWRSGFLGGPSTRAFPSALCPSPLIIPPGRQHGPLLKLLRCFTRLTASFDSWISHPQGASNILSSSKTNQSDTLILLYQRKKKYYLMKKKKKGKYHSNSISSMSLIKKYWLVLRIFQINVETEQYCFKIWLIILI